MNLSVQEGASGRAAGWVDSDSIVPHSLSLLGLLGNQQKWLS